MILHNQGILKPNTELWRHRFRIKLPKYYLGDELLLNDRLPLVNKVQREAHCVRSIGIKLASAKVGVKRFEETNIKCVISFCRLILCS